MQQRYYDQKIGRFLSVDPVTVDPVTGGGFNRYQYAANNPYRFVDPNGRQETTCTGSRTGCPSATEGATQNEPEARAAAREDRKAQESSSAGSGSQYLASASGGGGGGGGITPRDTVDAKIRDEIRKGNWEDAIYTAELMGGNVTPATARALEAISILRKAGYNPNGLTHVFKPKHFLDDIVKAAGSQEAAMVQIHRAAQTLANGAANGTVIRTSLVRVAGHDVYVSGRIIDGTLRVATARTRL
ncbi:RHS repeat-associated core domain-containing protein [Arenimonas alkanexedens]